MTYQGDGDLKSKDFDPNEYTLGVVTALNTVWTYSTPFVRDVWADRAEHSDDLAWRAWAGWIGNESRRIRRRLPRGFMRPVPKSPEKVYNRLHRSEEMAALYATGMTLAAIGEQYGIGKERVRQILVEHGVPAGRQARRELRRKNEQALVEKTLAPVREWLLGNGPVSRNELIEMFPFLTLKRLNDGMRRGVLPRHLIFSPARPEPIVRSGRRIPPKPGEFEVAVAAVRKVWLRNGKTLLTAQQYNIDRYSIDPSVLAIVRHWPWETVLNAATGIQNPNISQNSMLPHLSADSIDDTISSKDGCNESDGVARIHSVPGASRSDTLRTGTAKGLPLETTS